MMRDVAGLVDWTGGLSSVRRRWCDSIDHSIFESSFGIFVLILIHSVRWFHSIHLIPLSPSIDWSFPFDSSLILWFIGCFHS
ncbi:hypothetical protein THIOSC13_370004 [uncultured Thiomicrorhabdus sp.]